MLEDTEKEAYKLKVNKLMIEFDHGRMPDTDFINSFMPRVKSKVDHGQNLSDREKEVITDLFEKW